MAEWHMKHDLRICEDGIEIARKCEVCNLRSDQVPWGVTKDRKPAAYLCRECWKIKYAKTIARNRAKWKIIDKARRVGMTAEEYLEATGA